MIISALLFDLDGTLIDSAPDLVGALNWLRGREGLAPVDVGQFAVHAAEGAAGLLSAGMPPADSRQLEDWKQAFLEQYARHSFENSSLYEGIPQLLDYLDANDVPWGIVTNKHERLTHPVLQAAGLADRAGCVICGDTLAQTKPHPAPVLRACEDLDVRPAQALFAGDDVRDLEAGRAAGTSVAAIMYGYGSGKFNEVLVGDSLIVEHPRVLQAFLEAKRGPATETARS
ncbi:HAD-IA family hydrolase [Elongatibacter sediminis]|uniref:HAD-IA family hydrolase n=1 Tax=Elongatibacter sediminis TaxID=3119006 RepID=A0AAW9R8A7_9GAMM